MARSDFAHGRAAIVTGGAGFIGRALTLRLVAAGWSVTSLDRVGCPVPGVAESALFELADTDAISEVIRRVCPDAIFHLAACKVRSSELSSYREAIETNVLGTLSLVEALTAGAPEARLVAIGTAEEYGSSPGPYAEAERELPISAYSLSKLAMSRMLETLARVNGLRATVLRPSVCYGPGQPPDMFVSALVDALVAGREFPTTPGEQTRDFVYVDDLVEAIELAATREAAVGRIINVGSGVETQIRDLAVLVEQLTGAEGLLRIGAVPYRAGEQMRYSVDASLAKELLGWEASTPLEAGLRRTIDAARARG
jgi:UDP-glucose 4-epimerase